MNINKKILCFTEDFFIDETGYTNYRFLTLHIPKANS